MEKLKQNIPLVVGLAIPVVMMLVITSVIYFPRWFSPIASPQYDFIYAVGDGVFFAPALYRAPYAYPQKGVWPKYIYRVDGGKLIKEAAGGVPKEYGIMPVVDTPPKFYLHDVETNTSTSLTFEEAATYTLDTSTLSPDGYEVGRGGGHGSGFFPFFYDGSDTYNKRYIRKEYASQELHLNLPRDYYDDFFIAWVIK